MQLLEFACGLLYKVGTVVSHLSLTQFRLDGLGTSKLTEHLSYYNVDWMLTKLLFLLNYKKLFFFNCILLFFTLFVAS